MLALMSRCTSRATGRAAVDVGTSSRSPRMPRMPSPNGVPILMSHDRSDMLLFFVAEKS
jgi:hypothetical protein